jgi:hypothetical protein
MLFQNVISTSLKNTASHSKSLNSSFQHLLTNNHMCHLLLYHSVLRLSTQKQTHYIVYLASCSNCTNRTSALSFQGNLRLWRRIATKNSSLKILPDHNGPNSNVTLPGKRLVQSHPSKDFGESRTKVIHTKILRQRQIPAFSDVMLSHWFNVSEHFTPTFFYVGLTVHHELCV